MKILYTITGLGLGGAEKIVVDLADKMNEKGHDVRIVYLKGKAIVKPISNDISIHYLGLESLKDTLIASKKYRKLVADFKPDVIHAHMIHANIFARINRIGTYVPKLICSAHNSNEGGKLRMLGYRLTNFLSDFNTNVSNDATNSLIAKKAFLAKDIQTIYNGINLEKFKTQKADYFARNKINFLSIGRFNEQKDYPNLLNAIHTAVYEKDLQNAHFHIAGDGELRNEIELLINQLQLSEFVTLLGRKDNIPELINSADFFILSSKHEGLPTVLLEAIACGLFVIATDCGGSKEIMGGTGFLVPPQNSQALADAIIQSALLSDSERVNNNKQAQQYVQDTFDLNKISTKWEKIYAE